MSGTHKLITANLNGWRSASNKGINTWLAAQQADVVGFQELKMDASIIDDALSGYEGFHTHHHTAEKKGYSGVALLSKREPTRVTFGCGVDRYDAEGRVLRLDFPEYSVLNVYLPSGTMGDVRQAFKEEFMGFFGGYVQALLAEHPRLIIMGDFNIAHKEIDIHNPKANKNSSGFLPQERAWLTEFLALGLVDSFRQVNPGPHQYTWWSMRGAAREKNLGWRLDYQFVSSALSTQIDDHVLHPELRYSDHCPTVLTLKV